MFAILLILFILGIYITAAFLKVTLFYMPYVLGGIASLIICSQNPGIQTWIPGHPWMCYFTILALVEAVIAILMHINHISRAVITFCCSVFTGVLGAVIFEELAPDSTGYCVFVSIVYLVLSTFAIRLNLRNIPEESRSRGVPAGVVSGVLYGLSAACIFGFLAEGVWKPYFVSLGKSADRIELIINAVCITGVALFLLGVLLSDLRARARQKILDLQN
ncbi:MAG: hypothetical protein PUD05_06900 [Lachnospiraceae bacterium]|nr:hypothetical protein [Lachnospiraceae bacterium]MDD5860919.1 hypothetical protein [Eubacteriales bacterium]